MFVLGADPQAFLPVLEEGARLRVHVVGLQVVGVRIGGEFLHASGAEQPAVALSVHEGEAHIGQEERGGIVWVGVEVAELLAFAVEVSEVALVGDNPQGPLSVLERQSAAEVLSVGTGGRELEVLLLACRGNVAHNACLVGQEYPQFAQAILVDHGDLVRLAGTAGYAYGLPTMLTAVHQDESLVGGEREVSVGDPPHGVYRGDSRRNLHPAEFVRCLVVVGEVARLRCQVEGVVAIHYIIIGIGALQLLLAIDEDALVRKEPLVAILVEEDGVHSVAVDLAAVGDSLAGLVVLLVDAVAESIVAHQPCETICQVEYLADVVAGAGLVDGGEDVVELFRCRVEDERLVVVRQTPHIAVCGGAEAQYPVVGQCVLLMGHRLVVAERVAVELVEPVACANPDEASEVLVYLRNDLLHHSVLGAVVCHLTVGVRLCLRWPSGATIHCDDKEYAVK